MAKRLLTALLMLHGGAVAQEPPATDPVVRDLAGQVLGLPDREGLDGPKPPVVVTLWHNDMERDRLTPLAEGFADPDGTFAFSDVSWFDKQEWGSHAVMLYVRSGDLVGITSLRGVDVPLEGLRVTVARAVEIRGTLWDEETGDPAVGLLVWPARLGAGKREVWWTQPFPPWQGRTDENGRFVLRGVPELAPYLLRAVGPKHALSWVTVEDRTQVEADIPRGACIRGVVLLPGGAPAARIPVTATGRGVGYGTTLSGDDGTFVLPSLGADEYKVFAEAPDLTVLAITGLVVQAGEEVGDQTVQLVRGGFIVGRIVDAATGKAVEPGPSTDVAMYGPARGSGGSCECTPVLADGTFRIRAPAGTNRIYLRAANGWSQPSEYVVVEEGKETEVVWEVTRGRPRK